MLLSNCLFSYLFYKYLLVIYYVQGLKTEISPFPPGGHNIPKRETYKWKMNVKHSQC